MSSSDDTVIVDAPSSPSPTHSPEIPPPAEEQEGLRQRHRPRSHSHGSHGSHSDDGEFEMAEETKGLKIAFIHPDLGIGGAERLVVDAALGLQKLGHTVHIYTSHHDKSHAFEETIDGTLTIHPIPSPFPRHISNKLHILLAHLRQLWLSLHLLLSPNSETYDVFFVDQLSTCVPLLRGVGHTRVVFYCHFPDKLLAGGEYVEDGDGKGVSDDETEDAGKPNANERKEEMSLLNKLYRVPMDWLEETTTRQADIILANSHFTARVFKAHFPSITKQPRVVYPGINPDAYAPPPSVPPEGGWDEDVRQVKSDRPTLLSLNRFEKKKNLALAVKAFALLKPRIQHRKGLRDIRLVLAGGYDPRLENNLMTLVSLIDLMNSLQLTYTICKPSTSNIQLPPFSTSSPHPASSSLSSSSSSSGTSTSPSTTFPPPPGTSTAPSHSSLSPPTTTGLPQPQPQPQPIPHPNPDILILLNFSTPQRAHLLHSPHTLCLLYTPTNEHFGIGPLEGMIAGLPVLATRSGGPMETVRDGDDERTGWLVGGEGAGDEARWADALVEMINMTDEERRAVGQRGRARVIGSPSIDGSSPGSPGLFGLEGMARALEGILAEAVGMGRVGGWVGTGVWAAFVVVLIAVMGVPLVVFG